MMHRLLLTTAAILTLAACSPAPSEPTRPADTAQPTAGPAPATPPAPTADAGEQGGTDLWRTVANAEDQSRVDRLADAWSAALREADHEHGAEMDALGMLLVPTAGLAGNLQPAPGKYKCRTVKVGALGEGMLTYVAYPVFTCTIALTPGGDLILTKTGGSQRTRGLLYPDPHNDKRLVFVGAQAWGTDEKDWPAYGQIPERDQVGVFERVGTDRWRLVLPWPKQESKLEVLELKK